MKLFTREGVVTASTGISDSFDKTKAAVVPMATASSGLKFSDVYLHIHVANISSAAALTCMVTTDADGDDIILPSASASIETGLTTATSGGAFFVADVAFVAPRDSSADTWYVHLKTDAGTVDVSAVDIVGKSA